MPESPTTDAFVDQEFVGLQIHTLVSILSSANTPIMTCVFDEVGRASLQPGSNLYSKNVKLQLYRRMESDGLLGYYY
jgi:hypothetical protein